MIRFIEKPHSITGATMIEIWEGERLLGGIYAGSGTRTTIHIMSKHVEGIRPEGPDADGVAILEVLFR